MKVDDKQNNLGYVYHLYEDDMGDTTWYRHPILKITPKRIYAGGMYADVLILNRQTLEEKGEVWHGHRFYYSEAGMEEFRGRRRAWGYQEAPFADILFDPEKYADPPEPTLTAAEKTFAEELCRDYFAKNPDAGPAKAQSHLLKYDLSVPRDFIARLGLHKKRNTRNENTTSLLEKISLRDQLEEFIRLLDAREERRLANEPEVIREMYGKHGYDEGPLYWRIFQHYLNGDEWSRKVTCFVRREDGAILKADGWKRPNLKLKQPVRGNISDPSNCWLLRIKATA
jgi:hypothetical protein